MRAQLTITTCLKWPIEKLGGHFDIILVQRTSFKRTQTSQMVQLCRFLEEMSENLALEFQKSIPISKKPTIFPTPVSRWKLMEGHWPNSHQGCINWNQARIKRVCKYWQPSRHQLWLELDIPYRDTLTHIPAFLKTR